MYRSFPLRFLQMPNDSLGIVHIAGCIVCYYIRLQI